MVLRTYGIKSVIKSTVKDAKRGENRAMCKPTCVMHFITIKCHALQERRINERDFITNALKRTNDKRLLRDISGI